MASAAVALFFIGGNMTNIKPELIAFFDSSIAVLNDYLSTQTATDKKEQKAEYYAMCTKLALTLRALEQTTLEICLKIKECDTKDDRENTEKLSKYLETALFARKSAEEFLSKTELIIKSFDGDIQIKLREQTDILIRKEFLLKGTL